ncbi:Abi-alpha family protein [Halorientalis halophila]|uniref:Abi-alpha family protein n=1 Tax=Halorientalis halophila TaxID=3108499 RepID=UPI00300970ED
MSDFDDDSPTEEFETEGAVNDDWVDEIERETAGGTTRGSATDDTAADDTAADDTAADEPSTARADRGAARSADTGDSAGPLDGIATGDVAEDVEPLDPTTVTQVFDVLDGAVGDRGGDLGPDQVDQVLSVLEQSIVTPTPVDPTETERLLSVLEDTVVNPVEPAATEDVLSVLNTAIVDPTGSAATETTGVLSVIESAMADPTAPEQGIEEAFTLFDAALATLTDPSSDSEEVFSTLDSTVTKLFDPSTDTDELVSSLDAAVADLADPASDSSDPLSSVDSVMSHLLDPSVDEDVFSPPDIADVDRSSLQDKAGDIDDSFRVARIGAAALQRSSGYSVRSGVRTGPRLVRAAVTSESMVDLVEEVRSITLGELDRMGIDTGFEPDDADVERETDTLPADRDRLRRKGARLMEASADVDYVEEVHPAYASILDQVAPDEVRILRLLATEGRQPSIDVRDVGFVPLSSELIAAGLTMIGDEAGCQHGDRTHAYLNNLKRLGLIWFSDEPVEDVNDYQVLQAQPEVDEAIEEARRARIIRRSIHLTPFGVDFCREVLPVEVVVETAAGVYETPVTPDEREADRPEFPEAEPPPDAFDPSKPTEKD